MVQKKTDSNERRSLGTLPKTVFQSGEPSGLGLMYAFNIDCANDVMAPPTSRRTC